MKILVTGATGFLGRYLCPFLISKGHQLFIIGRGSLVDFKCRFSYPCEYYQWDTFLDKKIFSNDNIFSVDAIINLAGESIFGFRWTKEKKDKIYNSRIVTTRNLLDNFSKKGKYPSVVISASAVGYYGDRGNDFLDESSSPGQDFLAKVCFDWEKTVANFANHSRVINTRFGIVLSGSGGFLQKILPIFQKNLGSVMGSGDQWFSWIHIEDLLEVIHFCLLNKNITGPVNLTSPYPVTNRDLTMKIASVLQKKTIFHTPGFVLKLVLGEMSSLMLNSQRVVPQKLTDSDFKFRFNNIDNTLKNILKKDT